MKMSGQSTSFLVKELAKLATFYVEWNNCFLCVLISKSVQQSGSVGIMEPSRSGSAGIWICLDLNYV